IINSTLYMFFAPTKPISGSLLLNEYNKYLHWYKTLPAILAVGHNALQELIGLDFSADDWFDPFMDYQGN
ncbi:hypothetical protein H2201_009245, partial [Coniosporium apollinis]